VYQATPRADRKGLREGNDTKKLTKAEAVIRSVVIGALKGDPRSQATLFRLAEQVGQFEEKPDELRRIERVIVSWKAPDDSRSDTGPADLPAINQINRD
jgi:hypothetical protein